MPTLQPFLKFMGLGMGARTTDYAPCDKTPVPCGAGSLPGAMGIQSGDKFNETLFGFRIRQPDGWHTGWIRLQWFLVPPPDWPPIDYVELADYAIHPEPETPIAAGEPPRPTLHASVEQEEIVLSWHPVWTEFVLERASSLTDASWEPVPGVTNHTVRLPKAAPPLSSGSDGNDMGRSRR